jgi:hypothetical protein
VTHEFPGKKPQVTHTVEVKKTDKSGRVTTEIHQHGDDLGWHAGKSKWNSKPQFTKLPPPPSPSASLAFGDATASPQQLLPESYYTQTEALKGYAVTGKPPTRPTAEFLTSTKILYARNSTTNMSYGAWYMS